MATALPLRLYVEQKAVKDRLQSILGQRAPQFAAALVQIVNKSYMLQKCTPESVAGAAITAAALDLSVDPNLGECHLIPYGDQCQLQLGYMGLTQLALRSGQYHRLGWMVIRKGQLVKYDELTGELEVDKSAKTSDEIEGYAAKFRLANGFERGEYWTAAEMKAHSERYSQAVKKGKQDSPWFTSPEIMGLKTVLKMLLKRWGPKSILMQKAFASDEQVFKDVDNSIDVETAKEEEQTQAEEKVQVIKETVANVGAGPPKGEKPDTSVPLTGPVGSILPGNPGEDIGVLPPAVSELTSMLEGISFDDFKTFARLSCQKDLDDVPGYEDLDATFCAEVLTKYPKALGKFIKVYRK